MASIEEINVACERASETTLRSLGYLQEAFVNKADQIGALLLQAEAVSQGTYYQVVHEGFQQAANELGTALDGTQDEHLLGTVDVSRKAVIETEKLPDLWWPAGDSIKDALNAVDALHQGIKAVRVQGIEVPRNLKGQGRKL